MLYEVITCNVCVSSDYEIVPLRCTQNPTAGEEWRKDWHPEVIVITSYSIHYTKLYENVANIHEFGGTILGSSRGPQPVERVVDFLERRNISCLFVIGGDGTMRAASRIVDEVSKRKVRISVIGIPKTIDNDINFVSQTFGFDTAVEQATNAIRCAHVEALGAPFGIGLVKVMGRVITSYSIHYTKLYDKRFRA